ncbi:MAG: polyprenyl synthetase family protein [Acidobacteriota bacterium]
MKIAIERPPEDLLATTASAVAEPLNEPTAERSALTSPTNGASQASQSIGLPTGVGMLERLETICVDQGLSGLAGRLDDMIGFLGTDLAALEAELASIPRHRERVVGRAADRLLDLGGKRLRPLCLALAARIGGEVDQRVLDLAVAIELVHSATLLHDDVVDGADVRRGAATARAVYGNAASIFAGDWLLIEALRRVRRAEIPGLLEGLFDVIEEMIFAESLQLENRGRLSMNRETYFRVAEGKTASVFRWALIAGGRAVDLDDAWVTALGDYGQHLGVTFQAVDDLLDLTGESTATGKELFTDLREGKMTLPLILALERRPELRAVIEQIVALPIEAELPPGLAMTVIGHLRETQAVEDTRVIAHERSARAVSALDIVPPSPARHALATVAEAIVDRDL